MRAALAAAACAALLGTIGAPSHAQDAAQGKRLFDDTPNVSGLNNLTGNCGSCHGTVENRRIKIGGSRYAEISVAQASDRFRIAVASVGAMQQFDALTAEQVQDLAAYLADTPRVSEAQLDFTATAVNAATAPKSVVLRHAVAASRTLRVVGVAVDGPDATRFVRSADACDGQTLMPGGTCAVSLQFAATDTAGRTGRLVLTLEESGSAAAFTRSVALNGAVSPGVGPPAPTPGAASAADGGGGGAVSAAWLAGLALAVLSLAVLSLGRARRTG
ncbi:MAG: hypothetical protein AD742_14550 [Methylibium sp. NZG]|nr:MAG: hypothetical protein AD742_14550 [Methylibium sp. NZG]